MTLPLPDEDKVAFVEILVLSVNLGRPCGKPQNKGSVRLCCLMSSDVGSHTGDKLRPMRDHGSINLYVHGNQKAR